MKDLQASVSNNNQHFVPSNNLPRVYPFSDIGNDSYAFNLS